MTIHSRDGDAQFSSAPTVLRAQMINYFRRRRTDYGKLVLQGSQIDLALSFLRNPKIMDAAFSYLLQETPADAIKLASDFEPQSFLGNIKQLQGYGRLPVIMGFCRGTSDFSNMTTSEITHERYYLFRSICSHQTLSSISFLHKSI